ncbi:MAG: hypothetical protein WDZ41_02230 [Candidatus Babeliales bacterium]
MKKIIYSLLLCSIFNMISADHWEIKKQKTYRLTNQELTEVKTYTKDFASAMIILFSMFYIKNRSRYGFKTSVKQFMQTLITPLFIIPTIGSGLAYTKTFQNLIKNVPFIGSSIACDNNGCTGACNHCKFTKRSLALASGAALFYLWQQFFA